MPMTSPRRWGGAAALIQYSERTNRVPNAAANRKRSGNHQENLKKSLKPRKATIATAIDSHSRGSTPSRAASRGTNGTMAMQAAPESAVLSPIIAPDTPMRSISSDSSGTERLRRDYSGGCETAIARAGSAWRDLPVLRDRLQGRAASRAGTGIAVRAEPARLRDLSAFGPGHPAGTTGLRAAGPVRARH